MEFTHLALQIKEGIGKQQNILAEKKNIPVHILEG
jgi:hypothetical protein